jgi:hypothetical protein
MAGALTEKQLEDLRRRLESERTRLLRVLRAAPTAPQPGRQLLLPPCSCSAR